MHTRAEHSTRIADTQTREGGVQCSRHSLSRCQLLFSVSACSRAVQLVGDSLMSRGAQSLDELFKHTGLDIPTLKKCLLTLIQQDLVTPSYEKPTGRALAAAAEALAKGRKPRPPRVLYALQVDALRQRARYAQYLFWIKQCFGPECEFILQTLLLHGKLTSAQVMELTFASITAKARLDAQEMHRVLMQQAVAAAAAAGTAVVKPPPPPTAAAPSAFDRRRIHDVFRQLIASRYIKRAQGMTLPEDPSASADSSDAAGSSAAGGGGGGGSSGLNPDILKTFLANSAAAQQKDAEARAEAAAIKAASAAQAALKASTAGSVAAAAAPPAGRKGKRKIGVDDDDADDDAGAGGASKPAKKPKKKTKKELEAEAREAKLNIAAAARAKDEMDAQASLERTGAAAAAASSSDAAVGADPNLVAGSDDHILWSVNHSQFLWEFRKKSVVEYVTEQHSPAAGFIVAQLLHNYPADCCNKNGGERPPIFDTAAIVALCESASETQQVLNPVPNEEVATECMQALLADSSGFMERKSHPRGFLISQTRSRNQARERAGLGCEPPRCLLVAHCLSLRFSNMLSACPQISPLCSPSFV